jgi:molybdopterin-guanine dinucleotide biosynthesis protein B
MDDLLMRLPVIGVAGWKKSGKTTLTERLVAHFTAAGWRVVTLKHAHHAFDVDTGPTDSARHRRAGAREVIVVSQARVAHIRELDADAEPTLGELVARLGPADLILAEGWKRAPIRKIEARRTASFDRQPFAPDDPHVFAIAADHVPEAATTAGRPVFALDDIAGIADAVARQLGRPLGDPRSTI